mmetsp:Transcript_48375/g.89689  ORF Transcript_48375/g.89689 Transcript_48375/m.89689 type:complete len:98 (-) Transcript_48375:103-396(-)
MLPKATALEMLAPVGASPSDWDGLAAAMPPQPAAPVAVVDQQIAAAYSPKHTMRTVEVASVARHCYAWLLMSWRRDQSYEVRLPLCAAPSRGQSDVL